MEKESSPARRVAVVVVHGVADQRPGRDRACGCRSAGRGGAATDFLRGERPRASASPSPRCHRRSRRRARARRRRAGCRGRFFKAVVQSARSDFQRPGLASAADARGGASQAAPRRRASRRRCRRPRPGRDQLPARQVHRERRCDRGLRQHLHRARSHAPPAGASGSTSTRCTGPTCRASRGRFRASSPSSSRWSFASPSSGARRSTRHAWQLRGRDGQPLPAWKWLAFTQIALDWAFVNGLAALFAQLGLLAIIVMAWATRRRSKRRWAGSSVWPRSSSARSGSPTGAAMRCGAGSCRCCWLSPASRRCCCRRRRRGSWPLLFLALLSLGYNAALRVVDDRFPLTRLVGLVFWSAMLLIMIGAVLWRVGLLREPASLVTWVQAALLGAEVALYAVRVWWVLAAPLFIAWFVCGVFAAREGGFQGAASVGTGPARLLRVARCLRHADDGVVGPAQRPARSRGRTRRLSAGDLLRERGDQRAQRCGAGRGLVRMEHGAARIEPGRARRGRPRPPRSFSPPATKTTPRSSRWSRRCCCCWWPTSWPMFLPSILAELKLLAASPQRCRRGTPARALAHGGLSAHGRRHARHRLRRHRHRHRVSATC